MKGKRKAKQKNSKNQPNPKRQKKGGQKKGEAERFWIETCKETKNNKNSLTNLCMVAFLSRVELFDDHNQNGKNDDSKLSLNEINRKKTNNDKILTSKIIDPATVKTTAKELGNPCDNNLGYLGKGLNSVSATKSNEGTKDLIHNNGKILSSTESDGFSSDRFLGTNNETGTSLGKKQTICSITENNDEKTSGIANTVQEQKSSDLPASDSEKKHDKDYSKSFVRIIRARSAKWKPKKLPHEKNKQKEKFRHLPNGDAGDGIINPHPKNKVADKYWAQRKRLFSRFDQGIELDKEGWFSVTPEVIANHIASRVATSNIECKSEQRGSIVLDAFCGCGGNAIAFGLKDEISTVICVDFDRNKLRMAAHNASIYKVDPAKMIFIEANSINIMRRYRGGNLLSGTQSASKDSLVKKETCDGYVIGGPDLLPPKLDVIFLSPPWGGTDYLEEGKIGYDISNCVKICANSFQSQTEKSNKGAANNVVVVNGGELLCLASRAAMQKHVLYFLPRNINGISLGRSALKAGYEKFYELEQNVLNGKLKTTTAYFHENLNKPK